MWPVVAGQAVSLFGDYIAFFALPLFVVTLTGRERDLGLIAAAETLPMLLFGLTAGVLLDRVALRRALIIGDLVRAAAFALLASAVWLDVAAVWTVLAVGFLVGTMTVLFDSGLQAWLPAVFPADMLVAVNSRLQIAVTAASVLGPAAAGLIIGLFDHFEVAFVINAATFLVSAMFLLLVRELSGRSARRPEPFRRDLGEGLAYLWRERRIRWATLAAALANLAFAPVAATLVLYARDELGLDSGGIGLYFAAYAAIGAVGVVVAPRLARRIGLGRLFVVGMLLLGLGFLAVSWSQHVLVAIVPTGVAFAGVGWLNISLTTLRQRLTPEGLRGRVIASSRTIAWIGLPVGALVGGFVADAAGLIPVYRWTSAALILVAVPLLLTPLWSPLPEPAPAS